MRIILADMLSKARQHRMAGNGDRRAGCDIACAEGCGRGHQIASGQAKPGQGFLRPGGDQGGDGGVGIAVQKQDAHRAFWPWPGLAGKPRQFPIAPWRAAPHGQAVLLII